MLPLIFGICFVVYGYSIKKKRKPCWNLFVLLGIGFIVYGVATGLVKHTTRFFYIGP